jgi:DNA uptake protein ComE-like DNA-binding protein
VSQEGKKSADSVEDWLIEPAGDRAQDREPDADPESIAASTAQWLIDPPSGANGRAAEQTDAPNGDVAAPPPARSHDVPTETETEAETRAEEDIRTDELAAALGRLEKRAEEEGRRADREAKRADELADRVATLETDLEHAAKPEKPGKRGDSKKLQLIKDALDEKRAENADLAKQIRDLRTELRMQGKEAKANLSSAVKERDAEAKRRLTEVEADFDERLSQREAELRVQRERREGELRERIGELELALAEAKDEAKKAAEEKKSATGRLGISKRAKRDTKDDGLDVNTVTFEELRGLGLTVTQSARLIAYRDVREGYESLDELKEIPGLSAQTVRELQSQLTLSS